LETKDRK